jgi:hypothetical protein
MSTYFFYGLIFLLGALHVLPGGDLQAQNLKLQFHGNIGLAVPNCQLQQRNLLKAGANLGIGTSAEYRLHEKCSLFLRLDLEGSSFARNNKRIPSDCISEPCVTFVTTGDSVPGRGMRFLEVPISIGAAIPITKAFKLLISSGINCTLGAWNEAPNGSDGNSKHGFTRYAPTAPVQFKRIQGLVGLGLIQSVALSGSKKAFFGIDLSVPYSPTIKIAGYKNFNRDFQLRPAKIGLRLGLEI